MRQFSIKCVNSENVSTFLDCHVHILPGTSISSIPPIVSNYQRRTGLCQLSQQFSVSNTVSQPFCSLHSSSSHVEWQCIYRRNIGNPSNDALNWIFTFNCSDPFESRTRDEGDHYSILPGIASSSRSTPAPDWLTNYKESSFSTRRFKC